MATKSEASKRMKRALIGAGGLACIAIGWVLGAPSQVTRLTFLSVGQGDCAVFQTGDNAILIDDGPSDLVAQYLILPKLRKLGVSNVDRIFLSHPDSDHVAGTKVLLDRYPSAKVVISSQFRDNAEMKSDLQTWKLADNQVEWLDTDSHGQFGGFDLEIFCPPATTENDGSMIMRLRNGEASAEFSGDASSETEAIAQAHEDWSAEIMKAGHHGSRTATSDQWLRAVHPQYVVISCGLDNRYGHPHKETLARIAEEKGQMLRTDLDGTIIFELREGHFTRVR
ncbi:hypothetical protein BH11ARM1_BH11ARM1_01390 [soil metagenome]